MRFITLLLLLFVCTCGRAQIPSLSPLGELSQQVGNTQITVSYERPSVRERLIFGGLVPYDAVWRTGAGHCTKIGFDRAVKIAGQTVPPGKYALLTVPGIEEWIVILNTDTTLYGSKDYDRLRDVVRFRVPRKTSHRHYETMTIDLDIIPDNAHLYFSWANTQISFPIETTTADEVDAHVQLLLTTPLSTDHNYAWPAEYLLLQRRNLAAVEALINRQLEVEESEYAWRMLMQLNDYLGHPDRAIAAINNAIAFRKANPLDAKNQAWSLNFWDQELAKHEK